MKYYMYSLDVDIIEQLKPVFAKHSIIEDEEIITDIKTHGEYIKEYDDVSYQKLINKLGKKNAKLFQNLYLDLVDLKKLYDNIDLEQDNSEFREFKLSMYRVISQGRGIVILQHKEEVVEPKKKWFEFWKK